MAQFSLLMLDDLGGTNAQPVVLVSVVCVLLTRGVLMALVFAIVVSGFLESTAATTAFAFAMSIVCVANGSAPLCPSSLFHSSSSKLVGLWFGCSCDHQWP
ncbi:hypothetical protein Ancab_014191 [Ancistrocladus abbreviatus]